MEAGSVLMDFPFFSRASVTQLEPMIRTYVELHQKSEPTPPITLKVTTFKLKKLNNFIRKI